MTYVRLPGSESLSGAFSNDGEPVGLTRVGRWPKVGATSLLWFDDPHRPLEIERWRRSSTIVSIVSIVGDSDSGQREGLTVSAALDVLAEWGGGLDVVAVPSDAGGYAEALEGILRRIPDGWGRGFGHEAGWYRLVVELDARLVELDASYVVHQVKEKFGTLRFYCSPSGGPDSPVAESFDALVEEAQRASASICECCGSPGALIKRGGWLKTLCAACDGIRADRDLRG